MHRLVDDKSSVCIDFILERLKIHEVKISAEEETPPFFLGMNGVQGSGKTTLVTSLAQKLQSPPYSLPTAVVSIDDLYHPFHVQNKLAADNPKNPLIQHRGEPSTHDIPLALSVFASLSRGEPTKIPQYDKSKYGGKGDRVNESKWVTVNQEGKEKIKVVILEGWCVGFRALGNTIVEERWAAALKEMSHPNYQGQLGFNRLEDVLFVDQALQNYDGLTDQLNALIHVDAEDTQYVYDWRLDQEIALRAAKGAGMTDEQVRIFIDGYYPAYELYTERLRIGVFPGDDGKQLRLVVGKDRRVKQIIKM